MVYFVKYYSAKQRKYGKFQAYLHLLAQFPLYLAVFVGVCEGTPVSATAALLRISQPLLHLPQTLLERLVLIRQLLRMRRLMVVVIVMVIVTVAIIMIG